MKRHTRLRLLAAPLLIVLLLVSAPPAQAAVLGWPLDYFRLKEKPKDNGDKGRKKASVPEGSGGAALVLAAGVLSGCLLLSRRKRRAKEA